MKIADARAVVTGGASGLGLAVARHIVVGWRPRHLVRRAGRTRAGRGCGDSAAKAGFAKCDVTSETEVNAAMETARGGMGGINLLVNCAGVIGAGRVLGKNGPMAGDFFTRVVHINLIGTFLCDKAAAAIMQHNTPNAEGERGVIVHTSSVAAFEGQIGQAAYAATKAGVAGMTLPIARELAMFGIRVVRWRRASSARRCSRACRRTCRSRSASRCPSRRGSVVPKNSPPWCRPSSK